MERQDYAVSDMMLNNQNYKKIIITKPLFSNRHLPRTAYMSGHLLLIFLVINHDIDF